MSSMTERELGQTIRRLRIRKGLPLEDVAAKANLTPTSVRALELGRGSTLSTLLKVLSAIDETGFLENWASGSRETGPLQVLRASRNQTPEPKRVGKKARRRIALEFET